jgi:UDP-N-acetylglucosamine transferase subunit ALG13
MANLNHFLTAFGREQLEGIDNHTVEIQNALPEMMQNFSVIADCENVYQRVRDNLRSSCAYQSDKKKIDVVAMPDILGLFTHMNGLTSSVNKVLSAFKEGIRN